MGFLDKISKGKLAGPVKLVVYGGPAVGKTSFAATAPSPVLFDFENRSRHLDVTRYQPTSWPETGQALKEIVANPGEFKSVIIDSLDHMENLIHKYLCEQGGVSSIEDYDRGFGKGFVAAYNEFQRFLVLVEQLIAKGINVIMLAHSQQAKYMNPVGEDFDVFKLKLRGGVKSDASALIVEKADLVGFASFEDMSRKGKTDNKAKALTTGVRLLSFAHHPAFQSKAGVPLKKPVIPLTTWADFEANLDK